MEDVKSKESSGGMCYVDNVTWDGRFRDAVCEVEVSWPAEDAAVAGGEGAVCYAAFAEKGDGAE